MNSGQSMVLIMCSNVGQIFNHDDAKTHSYKVNKSVPDSKVLTKNS